MAEKKRVALLGSGNWGSAIARIIGENVKKFEHFENEIRMYVYEETIDGKKLTEIINTTHENVKYLKGLPLPTNIIADPDLVHSAEGADILIWVVPHAFVERMCTQLQGKVKKDAISVSLCKGFYEKPDGISLISDLITANLGGECAALMGANLANEVAQGNFCETTIGCRSKEHFPILKDLFMNENFLVTCVTDKYTVEICGALKNIVACAAGFSDGLKFGDNTKAAIIRLGLKEMIKFVKTFYPEGFEKDTFFESCGIADLVTTCYGGRNRKCSEAYAAAEGKKSIADLEKEMLNGQKLQGPGTAAEVYKMLSAKNELENFPLFVAVHEICTQKIAPTELIPRLRKQPAEK
ncbi:Glycerol-3-phosphate dehydrogenase [NAD(+)], cytoplasmic [Halotydeus destructor]|nr:Glycerol-3-phosphate dehydrogenase [NAD(+)], cytoplasmic [Halotydeus destructor]